MSVHQIEQYCISLKFKKPLSDKKVLQVNLILEDVGCLDWKFEDCRRHLLVHISDSEENYKQIQNHLYKIVEEHL